MKKQQPHTYSLLAMMMASATEPTPQFARTHQLTRMSGGLLAMVRGDSPKPDDWRVVCYAVNLMETLVISGMLEDADGTLPRATKAMTDAAIRSQQGKGIRLDAPGIEAVRGVLADYQYVLESLPHRTMLACHRDTEKRIREIHSGKRQAHDVEVTSL